MRSSENDGEMVEKFLSLMVQVQLLGLNYLPQALAASLLLLSLPMQGFYWLGKRANTPLPAGMANWYRDIRQQMLDKGCLPPKTECNRPATDRCLWRQGEVHFT